MQQADDGISNHYTLDRAAAEYIHYNLENGFAETKTSRQSIYKSFYCFI